MRIVYNLNFTTMNEAQVSVREFIHNFKKFSISNKIIIIADHGKPKGVYVPYDEWNKEKRGKKFSLKDLEKFCFEGGDRNLSSKIDEICYPYPNKLKK